MVSTVDGNLAKAIPTTHNQMTARAGAPLWPITGGNWMKADIDGDGLAGIHRWHQEQIYLPHYLFSIVYGKTTGSTITGTLFVPFGRSHQVKRQAGLGWRV